MIKNCLKLKIVLKALLDLLIKRYHVPEASVAFNIKNMNSLTPKIKDDMKQYKQKYYQPIQVR